MWAMTMIDLFPCARGKGDKGRLTICLCIAARRGEDKIAMYFMGCFANLETFLNLEWEARLQDSLSSV